MPYLTKQQILEANDRQYADVEVPEWGGTIRLATMTASQRDRYEVMFSDARRGGVNSQQSVRALLVAACAVDENGTPLFTVEDVEALGQKSGAALGRVFAKALDLNILTKTAAERVAGE